MINTYNRCDPIVGCGKLYFHSSSSCPSCGTPETFSDKVKADPNMYVYDIETYPNLFSLGILHPISGTYWSFECSPRINQLRLAVDTLLALNKAKSSMVGYNNLHFDYPVVHKLIEEIDYGIDHRHLYEKAQSIIDSRDNFGHMIWPDARYVKQIDLFKIHHFDNKARSTSLKELEFNMRRKNVTDLPYAPGTILEPHEIDVTIDYMREDIEATNAFLQKSMDKIAFRSNLTDKYGMDFTNHNDTKIGKDYFIMKLEEANPGCTKKLVKGKWEKNQTIRDSINLNDVVFDYINFSNPEFNRIRDWFKTQIIQETKGVFKGLHCTVQGFDYHFGVGGIHGSIDSAIVRSDDEYCVYDIDVKSYYPWLSMANGLYPLHLGKEFCAIYQDVYNQRTQHAKGTDENATMKLALNGVYGDSNNKYSPFYDPQYTMSITINGQLLLCLLADYLTAVPSLSMIQINTDGLTVKVKREFLPVIDSICRHWEKLTGLELEDAYYKAMYIRDVNNYIAEYEDGKLKRKGAYEYDIEWHKDHSQLVVPKAAEAVLVHGKDLHEFIYNHTDYHDFMLRTKVPRSNRVVMRTADMWTQEVKEVDHQRITRFYVSKVGGSLCKIAPPVQGKIEGQYKKATGVSDAEYNTVMAEIGPDVWDERIHTKNKSIYQTREMSICKGYLTTECNDFDTFDVTNLDRQYYIDEAKKLIDVMKA